MTMPLYGYLGFGTFVFWIPLSTQSIRLIILKLDLLKVVYQVITFPLQV